MKSLILVVIALLIAAGAGAQGPNKKPRITGQQSLSTDEDQSVTILMSYLYVEDPDDWFYPWGFTMKISPGDNYSFSGHVVTPAANFSGKLRVKLTVHDGQDESNKFDFEITVNPVNDTPVITGHTALSANEEQAFTILPEHLKVTDPDNKYPDQFSLTVHNGSNYTVSGNQVTPNAGFTGTLTVNVSVNDGTVSSATYALPVTIKAVDRVPEIVDQTTLQVLEEGSLTISLSHLSVSDEDSKFPDGFSLSVSTGQNYSVSGTTITAAKDFFGRLTVPITVSDGKNTSKPFNLVVLVTPVNDPPRINSLEGDPVSYNASSISVPITQTLAVEEVDGDSIMFAEVSLDPETYQVDVDKLLYTQADQSNIRGVFDANSGVLTLLGQASPKAYQRAIRSVEYECLLPARGLRKRILFSVNDGKGDSEQVSREIVFGAVAVSLDIPSGFTPNGDLANDTWKIIPLKEEESYAQARVRVYTKEGVLVYESIGLQHEWDGRYNGDFLPAATYFYTIDLNINAPEGYLKGLVTILR